MRKECQKYPMETVFFVNGDSSPAGDGWCKLTNNKREIHQYKLVHEKSVNYKDFEKERKKAASAKDLFLYFSVFADFDTDLPEYSGFIGVNQFQDYYGPFAGRAFRFLTPSIVDINTANRMQLEYIHGVGQKLADEIIKKRKERPFENCEDVQKRIKIGQDAARSFQYSVTSKQKNNELG